MTEENKNPNKGLLPRLKSLFRRRAQTETVRETIEELIEESTEGYDDSFSEHEQQLLNNVLYLKDKKCCHVMVPRNDIIAFHQDGNVIDLAKLMVEKGHSRIPIYGDSLDDIVGILHIIDLATCMIKGEDNRKVKEIVTNSVKFVSPQMGVLDLLRDMQNEKVHIAIVIDEYGGVNGLVTIEDLLEEIVGNIEDEYDFEEQHSIIKQGNLITTDAKTEIEELKTQTGIDFEKIMYDNGMEDVIDTIGGLVFHIAQRIPNRGEVFEWLEGIKFRVIEVSPNRIKKITIILPEVKIQEDTSDNNADKKRNLSANTGHEINAMCQTAS